MKLKIISQCHPNRFFRYAWGISEAYFLQVYLNENSGLIPDISQKLYLENMAQAYPVYFPVFCLLEEAFEFLFFVCKVFVH